MTMTVDERPRRLNPKGIETRLVIHKERYPLLEAAYGTRRGRRTMSFGQRHKIETPWLIREVDPVGNTVMAWRARDFQGVLVFLNDGGYQFWYLNRP